MAQVGCATAGRCRSPAPTADSIALMIPLIYEAALAPAGWPAVLVALAGALGGSAADLRAGPTGAAPGIAAAHGVPPEAIRSYDAVWGACDPVTAAAGDGAAWRRPANARQAAGAALEDSAFFAGWMRPNGIDDDLCLSLLPPAASHRAVLGIARPPRRPRFGSVEATALGRLAPHLRRAMEVHRRLAAPLAGDPLAAALDRLAHGVVLVDAGGALGWANRAGLRLLAAADGIALDRHGRLRAATPVATEALGRTLALALAGEGAALPLPRPSGGPPLALLAVPLPPSQASAPDLLSATPAARILLLLTDPVHGRPDATLEQRLRALWGLTAAEAVVAAQTAHGAGLPEVAQVLGLAVTTARTHAQRVFAKAGLRGQAELARQVERLSLLADEVPDSLPPRAPAHAASWSHPIA